MHVSVRIGGHTSPWRFRGSAAVERWLDILPWQRDGGVRALELKGMELVKRFSEAVRSAVYGRDSARTHMRLHGLEVGSGPELQAAVWRRLDVRERPTEYERLLELARRLEERPAVFLVSTVAPNTGEVFDAADSILDQVDKVGGQVRPAFVLLLTSMLGVRGLPDDFTSGWPIGCEPTQVGCHLSEAWYPYVHQRLAWETAGDLLRAESWDASYKFHRLVVGNDDGLEACLNEAARHAYEQIPSDMRQRLESRLAKAKGKGNLDESLWQPWEQLRQAGLVWLTPGNQSPEPTPWLARALLLRQVQGPVRHLLRNCLVCAPLARQILSACFDLEAHEREHCSSHLPGESHASQQALDAYRRFQSGDRISEVEFYPAGCPARPNDVWQFASWGEVIELARPSTSGVRTRLRHDLRTLRNSLSHGHYAAWKMVCRLRAIQEEFGLAPETY